MAEAFRAALSAPVDDRPSSQSSPAAPPCDLARRHVALAGIAKNLASTDGDEITLDMASLLSAQGATPTVTETTDAARRRSTVAPALLGLGLTIVAVAAIHPFEQKRSALASRPAEVTAQLEPSEPPSPAPVASTSSPMSELEPPVIVPGKPNGASAPPRRAQAVAPSPPKEPDRGF